MIYGRFGNVVTIERMAVLADVKVLDNRRADKHDKAALVAGSYVVVRGTDDKLRLYHLAFLRADGGSREITAAIEAVK